MAERYENKILILVKDGNQIDITRWCLEKFGPSKGRYDGWPRDRTSEGSYFLIEFKDVKELFYFWLVWAN